MQPPATSISRRALLGGVLAAPLARAAPPAGKQPVCAFSKHFQWADWKEMARVVKELGYDGVDLTVRSGGHVLPERVADDLPKAAEAIHAAGLSMPMITTGIVDAATPHAEAIIRAASRLGVKRYRFGDFRYDTARPFPPQLEEAKARTKALADMNKSYGVCAMYHTHSGIGRIGASMWDIWLVMKDLDNSVVGINLDIGHATVEGGFGGWINATRLLLPITRGIAVKDFYWEKNAKGQWRPRWCALGNGMVDFAGFLKMVRESGFEGPLQLHMEYDELGGADTGKSSFTIPREKLMAIMRRDMETFRGMLRAAGIS